MTACLTSWFFSSSTSIWLMICNLNYLVLNHMWPDVKSFFMNSFHLVCIKPFPLHLSLIFNCSPFSPCFPKSSFTQPPLLPLSTSPPCLFTNRLSRDPFHSSLEGLQIRCVLEVCCNFLGKIVSKIDMCPEKGALSRGKIIFQPRFYSGVASRGDTHVSSQLHLLLTILFRGFL